MVLLTILQSVIGLVLLLRYRTVKAQSVLDPMPAHSN